MAARILANRVIFKFGPDGVVRWFWGCTGCKYFQMLGTECQCNSPRRYPVTFSD